MNATRDASGFGHALYCRRTAILMLLIFLLFTGCGRFPHDPDHTLNRVLARGSLRAGAIAGSPWVIAEEEAVEGVEADLIRGLARDLGVEMEWRVDTNDALFRALEHKELDVVIGGITSKNPWSSHVAFTLPYFENHYLVGAPQGVDAPTPVRDKMVTVPTGSDLTSELEQRGALVVAEEDIAGVDGLVAAEEWELLGHGYELTDLRLRTEKMVFAAPAGENAWILRIEEHLLRNRDPQGALEEKIQRTVQNMPIVQHVEVRLREEGHVFSGEIFVTLEPDVSTPDGYAKQVDEIAERTMRLDERLYELVVVPVTAK